MNNDKQKEIICVDLDGTLSDESHRLHLSPRLNPHTKWIDYHLLCGDDLPFTSTMRLVKTLARAHEIHILTARLTLAEQVTREWLKRYDVPYDALTLSDGSRKSYEYKAAYIQSLQQRGLLPILLIDNDPRIAKYVSEQTSVEVLLVNSSH